MSDNKRPDQLRKRANKVILETPELKNQLQEMAMIDLARFFEIMKIDGLQIFICADAAKGRSLQAITNRLKAHGIEVGRSTVADRCRKCAPSPDNTATGI